jgi:hypothetical protein
MEERSLAPAQLAVRLGDSQQTVDHILHGTEGLGRIRQSRLSKIARLFDVPEGLLTGDPIVMPALPPVMRPWVEFGYSTRTQLAASRLLTKVMQAVNRDLQDPSVGPASDDLGVPPLFILREQMADYVGELLRIGEWRRRLIVWETHAWAARGFTEPATDGPWDTPDPRPVTDPEHEAAVLALARAFEHILKPWFDGDARLNYRSLRDLTYLPEWPFLDASESAPISSPLAALIPKAVPGPAHPTFTRTDV